MAFCMILLLLTTAGLVQHASSSAGPTRPDISQSRSLDTAWARLRPANATRAPLIAVLAKRDAVLTRFRLVCGGLAATTNATMPEACQRLTIQRACRHVFTTTIIGVSGHFTRQQLADLQECAGGADAIVYLSADNQVNCHYLIPTGAPQPSQAQGFLAHAWVAVNMQVKKAEGSSHGRWWTYRPPTGLTLQQLQQLSASKLAAATAAGVTATGTGINPELLPVAAADGPANLPPTAAGFSNSSGLLARSSNMSSAITNVTLALIQRWILAEVGLAAQQQLARPNMQQLQVTAADGAPDAHVVTADATGADGDTLSVQRGSKNQDPGIAVDPKAVAQPDIIVRTTGEGGSSSSRSAAPQELQQPLSLSAAEQANESPGIKEQRLVNALWNLDRIDQRQLPLNSTFSYGSTSAPGTGKGVRIYVLDSGIRASHQEFKPWDGSGDSRITVGPDFVNNDGEADDCDGHGTHVSSTAAGRSVGVAKEAHVVAVRVLDCDGAGSISNVVAGLDWVAKNAVKPAVVSLSLGVPAGQWSQPMEDAIEHLTDVVGIPVVVAAGNSAQDSCGVAPARVPSAITVAASNIPTKFSQTRAGDSENLYSWSNTGACVKLFAPGVDIYGACGGASRCATLNDSSYTWASGTSMAAPHVTGAVAVYLEAHPQASPSEVMAALVAAASTGHVADAAMLPGTPNKLLYTGQQQ